MSGELRLLDRQRARSVDLRVLRKIVRRLLAGQLQLENFDLTIHLVNSVTMARLNETHLQHAGPTDVITLDYSAGEKTSSLVGEIFVCVDEALIQARRFRSAWQSELLRYIIHGVLHLRGFDDHHAASRLLMKREEDRLLAKLARDFDLRKLRRKSRIVSPK